MESEFGKVIYAIVQPPSKIISTARIQSVEEYNTLRKEAKRHKSFLYYAELVEKDNKVDVKQPWKLDIDSIYCRDAELAAQKRPPRPPREEPEDEPDSEPTELTKTQEIPKEDPPKTNPLQCPYCGKVATSTPGRTLHIKSKHPEKYEEYKKNQ